MHFDFFAIFCIILILTVTFSGCTNSNLSLYNNRDDEQLYNLFMSYNNQTIGNLPNLTDSLEKENFFDMEVYSQEGLEESNEMIIEVQNTNPSAEWSPLKNVFLIDLNYMTNFYSNFEYAAKEFQKGNKESGFLYLDKAMEEWKFAAMHYNASFELIEDILHKKEILLESKKRELGIS
jgi:hypothetical protein